MKTEVEILKMGDEILTENKKNPNHIIAQLNKDESISYNTGFHTGFILGYTKSSQNNKEILIEIIEKYSKYRNCDSDEYVRPLIADLKWYISSDLFNK